MSAARTQRPVHRADEATSPITTLAQVAPRRVAYIANTPMFVQIAETLGITSILHADYRSTSTKLVELGLGPHKGPLVPIEKDEL